MALIGCRLSLAQEEDEAEVEMISPRRQAAATQASIAPVRCRMSFAILLCVLYAHVIDIFFSRPMHW